MIIVLKDKKENKELKDYLNINKIKSERSILNGKLVYSVNGKGIDREKIANFEAVEKVLNISSEAYKVNSNKDVIVNKINFSKDFNVIAGPCSVESYSQLIKIAKNLKEKGIKILRAGAFKPRTSPYSFQGLGKEGLEILSRVKKETGLFLCCEILDKNLIDDYKDIDILQVGARNMQNYDLLKALAKQNKPILLKRGMGSTVNEFLLSAEYLMQNGNKNIILCERGIKTFENGTRNTLDLSSVSQVKHFSSLPIIVDPSHAAGRYDLIESMSLAAVAAGADGLLIEVHDKPSIAMSDGKQSLKLDKFSSLLDKVSKLSKFMRKI